MIRLLILLVCVGFLSNAQAQVDYAIAWQYFNLLSKHQCSIQHDRHFTINNRGQCTYTPAGKPTILTSNFTWLSGNGRQVTKFGKAIKKLLAYKLIDIPDYAIEIIQNHIIVLRHKTFCTMHKIL